MCFEPICDFDPTRSAETKRPWMLGTPASRASALRAGQQAAQGIAAAQAAQAADDLSKGAEKGGSAGFGGAGAETKGAGGAAGEAVGEVPGLPKGVRAQELEAARAKAAVEAEALAKEAAKAHLEATHLPTLEVAATALEVCANAGDASWGCHSPLLRALAPLLRVLGSRRGRTLPRHLASPLCQAVASLAQRAASKRALEPAEWILDALLLRVHEDEVEGGGGEGGAVGPGGCKPDEWGGPFAALALALLVTDDPHSTDDDAERDAGSIW